jgi:hypothetical protein
MWLLERRASNLSRAFALELVSRAVRGREVYFCPRSLYEGLSSHKKLKRNKRAT